MPIEIIAKDHYAKIFGAFSNCNNSIRIITPFITRDMAKKLIDIIDLCEINCTLISRFKRQDFIDGVSSIFALQDLINSGVEILALKKLHTKLYIIDDNNAIIGSANFTAGGFKNNHELSLLLTDEPEIVSQLISYYKELHLAIKSSGTGVVTEKLIEGEIEEINKFIQKLHKGIKTTTVSEFGASLEDCEIYESNDVVQEIFATEVDEIEETIWLKFEGVASDRFDNTQKYSMVLPKSIGKPITCFPANKKPTSFKEGDYVYIAVLSKDKNGKAMPIIIARGRSHKFEPTQIADKELISKYKWMEHWPAYVILYDVELLDTELANGINHSILLGTLQNRVYESTKNKVVSMEKLKESHLQKSAIKLTCAAKQFIDEEFEKLKIKYGIRVL